MKRTTRIEPKLTRRSVTAGTNMNEYSISDFTDCLRSARDMLESMDDDSFNEIMSYTGTDFYDDLLQAIQDLAQYDR